MKNRSPVKWHGGKSYMAPRIIAHFPPHRVYLEAFGGGASVLLHKPPAEVETYNDLDGRITRLFRVLRDQGEAFRERARLIPYSRVEFEDARCYPPGASDLDMALCDFVRWRQSRGGRGEDWSYTTTRTRGGRADVVNAWQTAVEGLDVVTERLRRVQIDREPALKAIDRFDQADGLIYCDPPYVHATRAKGCTDVYGVEMTDDDHRRLAEVLARCQAKVIVSGYPSPLYDELYAGWQRAEYDIANHAAGGKSKARKKECLWMKL